MLVPVTPCATLRSAEEPRAQLEVRRLLEADLRSSKSFQSAGNTWTRVWTNACTWDTAKKLASLALTAIGTACLYRGCRERHTRRVLSLYCVLPLLKVRSAELPLQVVLRVARSAELPHLH